MDIEESFRAEYIVELSARSFMTVLILDAPNVSNAIRSVLDDEFDSAVSILAMNNVSDDDHEPPLIDYDDIL